MSHEPFAFSPEQVLDGYTYHPHHLETLVGGHRRRAGEPLREDDLARASRPDATDQNHVGGAAFVLELAEACRIGEADRVLDVGSGIGGPARLLASRHGCSVHGIELNPHRHAEAVELTRLTRLCGLVTFTCADFMTMEPRPDYSVIWGQSSWSHIADRRGLLAAIASWLVPGGRVAFEDICLARDLRDERERDLFATVSDAWRSSFAPVSAWRDAFVQAGLTILLEQDCSEAFIEGQRAAVQMAEANPSAHPARERTGWQVTRDLGERGALCYLRMVARRP